MHAKNHPNVMVECEDGDTYYADHVICTIPLGMYCKNPFLVKYRVRNSNCSAYKIAHKLSKIQNLAKILQVGIQQT